MGPFERVPYDDEFDFLHVNSAWQVMATMEQQKHADPFKAPVNPKIAPNYFTVFFLRIDTFDPSSLNTF
jgi:hypothetical protein